VPTKYQSSRQGCALKEYFPFHGGAPKNLFRSAKNFAIFLALHSKDFFNAARSIVDDNVL